MSCQFLCCSAKPPARKYSDIRAVRLHRKDRRCYKYRPAGVIVENIVKLIPEGPSPALPKLDTLNRIANMARQRDRPADPTDLKFELVDEKIPSGFVRVDVEVFTFFHLLSFCLSKIVGLSTIASNYY